MKIISKTRSLSFHTNITDADGHQIPLEGYFSTPSTRAWEQMNDRLDSVRARVKTYHAYLSNLDRMIEKEPDLLDAYNDAGWELLEMASTQMNSPTVAVLYINKARDYFIRAFDRAYALIPKEFKGQIIWRHLNNRPFLRAHNGIIQCLLRTGQYAEAAKMIRNHLKWNPNDNIGVRYQLGDACLLAGDTANARKAYAVGVAEDMSIYPPNAYSLGLLEFREGNYSSAATALRLGFISNIYIAEMLTGRIVKKPHFFWHGTSDATVQGAKEYLVEDMRSFWESTPQAIDFIDWLFNCAKVMRERLEYAEICEGLTYEHELAARSTYCDRADRLRRNIAKTALLLQKVTDRRGGIRWPWEHSRTDLMLENK